MKTAENMALNADFLLYGPEASGLNGGVMALQKPAPAPARDTPGPVTFEDLIVAVGKGRNRDAFIRLFEYFAPRVKSFLMKSGMTPDQAEELAQETMLAVWQKAEGFDPRKATASTWIFTIARNKRIDALRKATLRQTLDLDDVPEPADDSAEKPDALAARQEERQMISAALKTLPPEQADLLHKSFFEDKTHGEIAAETNLPLGTIKSRIRLAMDKLRQHLGAEDAS